MAEQQEKEPIPPFNAASIEPLEKIALTFSGGGYRAAAFALGVLSYFNKIKLGDKSLLHNVKAISTVSGGTITGAVYAANPQLSFDDFYNKMYKFLHEDRLMDDAMDRLENNEHWETNHKKQSLINAFAESYFKLLVQERFGALSQSQPHLQDIVFNATEFNNANAFRFQTTGQFGNSFTHCDELDAVKDSILIADAIAASSCFPLGFEPIIFPDDFMKRDAPGYESLKRQPQFTEGLGLMDGGIVDNQGVGSIVLADNRRARKEMDKKDNIKRRFDLLMICDVGGPLMQHWRAEEDTDLSSWQKKTPKNIRNFIYSLGKRMWIPVVVLFIGIALGIAGEKIHSDIFIWVGGITAGIGIALLLFWIAQKIFAKLFKALAEYLVNTLPHFAKSKLKYFDDLATGLLTRMLKERLTSAISMTSEVFMKQVRRFTYYQVYQNPDWKYRRTATLIYELTHDNFRKKKEREKELFALADAALHHQGDKIAHAASVAASMPTTLWFSEEDKKLDRLNHLIACGQFTTCFNLLYYLGEIKNDPKSPLQAHFTDGSKLDLLYKQLLEEWKMFKANPLRLL